MRRTRGSSPGSMPREMGCPGRCRGGGETRPATLSRIPVGRASPLSRLRHAGAAVPSLALAAAHLATAGALPALPGHALLLALPPCRRAQITWHQSSLGIARGDRSAGPPSSPRRYSFIRRTPPNEIVPRDVAGTPAPRRPPLQTFPVDVQRSLEPPAPVRPDREPVGGDAQPGLYRLRLVSSGARHRSRPLQIRDGHFVLVEDAGHADPRAEPGPQAPASSRPRFRPGHRPARRGSPPPPRSGGPGGRSVFPDGHRSAFPRSACPTTSAERRHWGATPDSRQLAIPAAR